MMRIAPRLKSDNPNYLDKDAKTGKASHWTQDDWLLAINRPDPDWRIASQIIRDRIYGRFFRAIPRIENLEGVGLAILALDSLIIETLFQFQHGWLDTPYSRAEEVFNGFLIHQIDGFDKDTACTFREDFRNGLVHSAEIHSDSTVVNYKHDERIIWKDENVVTVNRAHFHPALVKAFDRYIKALTGDIAISYEVTEELRVRAKLKMNQICHQPFLYSNIHGNICEVPYNDVKEVDKGKKGFRQPMTIIDTNGSSVWVQTYIEKKKAKYLTEQWAEKLGIALKAVDTP